LLKALTVRVVPNVKIQKVLAQESVLKIWVNAPAHHGKANRAVIELLAKHLNVKKRRLRLLRGEKSHIKSFVLLPERL
jgi:uncharacterized protein YggU (UPF0235/DUF167 family)